MKTKGVYDFIETFIKLPATQYKLYHSTDNKTIIKQ